MGSIVNTNTNSNEVNSERKSKYIQFGEIKDDYDKAKLTLTQEFPMCFGPISALFDCERLNSFPPSTSKNNSKNNKACKNENAHLNFCILSSFCPLEASLLMDCTKGIIPHEDTKIPSKCSQYFNSFDNCLQRKTKEFEDRNQSESEPISKVIYGDQTNNNINSSNNNALYDCERSNSLQPSSSKFMENNPCKKEFALADFCIYSSFCPLDSKLLMDCTNNIPDGESKLPIKCWEQYNSFDVCLENKIKEFEERSKSKK